MQDHFAPTLKESILYYAKRGIEKTLSTVLKADEGVQD